MISLLQKQRSNIIHISGIITTKQAQNLQLVINDTITTENKDVKLISKK